MGKIAALILFCATLFAHAQADFGILAIEPRVAAGGGACSTIHETGGNTGGGADREIGQQTINKYQATWFRATNSATLCSVSLKLKAVGSPTMTLTARIYSYSSGSSGTVDSPLGTASDVVNSSTVTASYTMINFPNLSASIVAGTDYCLVIAVSSVDVSNYLHWDVGGDGNFSGHNTEWRSDDGVTWTQNDIVDLSQGVFNLYK